jgi:DNA-directed RNA polymerase subunit RPC12/RpoP
MSEPISRKQRWPLPDSASVIAQALERRQAVRHRLHPASERLPSERCPHCGSERRPTPMDSGLGTVRAYRCLDCRRSWSVDGRQETLFGSVDGEQIDLDLSA